MDELETDLKPMTAPDYTFSAGGQCLSFKVRRLLVILAFLLSPAFILAQGRTGVISGTVSDTSENRLPGVSIEAVNMETGVARNSCTDERGRYEIPALEVGRYQVTFTQPGFKTFVQSGVVLTLERQQIIDVVLQLGELHQEITVREALPTVDTTFSGHIELVDEKKIQELPLNGRDVLQLALVQSGAQSARAQGRGVNTGQGVQISIFGSRPAQNSFRLDGLSITDYTGGTPGSINGINLGVDAVQEFTVMGANYSAQYGRAAGGVINIVTRAGTNDLRGALFFFHRNDNLDARNFFDEEKLEFRRHQFGGSLGGPIRPGKTFFFGAYEGLRESRGRTQIDTTLSDSARLGQLQSGSVVLDPATSRFLSLYPRANGETLGDTGLFVFPNNNDSREDYGSIRLDHTLGPSDSVFTRYTLSSGEQSDQTTFATSDRLNTSRNQYLVLEESHTFSPTLFNTGRAGLTRVRAVNGLTVARSSQVDTPEMAFVPEMNTPGAIEVVGMSTFPGGTRAPDFDANAFTSLQFQDDLWFMRGAHSLKLGGVVERLLFNPNSQNRGAGEFRFATLADFLTNRPQLFRSQLPGSSTIRGWRQTLAGWYLQDDWKASRSLTLNLGLRHEWTTVPNEVNGRIANLDELTSPEMRLGAPLYRNPSYDNFAPRVGLAWSPSRRLGTSVRAAYGVFYDQLLVHFLLIAGVRNPPFFLRGQIRNLQPGDFPGAGYQKLAQSASPELRVERLPKDMRQPYAQQWNLTIEQPLGAFAVARLAYIGSRGVHLSAMVEDANLVTPVLLADGRRYFPENGQKLNPNFGMIRDRLFDGNSFYHGLQAAFRRGWDRGFQSSVSYTFSKSVDDDSASFSHDEAENAIGIPVNGDHKFNRGPSNHDIRHNLTAHAIWQLPELSGTGLRRLAAGWQISALGTFSSGLPFSATLGYDAARTGTSRPSRLGGQRPDLRPGANNNPVTGDPNRWFDPSAFQRPEAGFLGNLGRNTLRGPRYASLDVSVSRRLPLPSIGKEGLWQLRFEVFNALNHTNLALPSPERTEVFGTTSIPEDVGRITEAFPSREIQLGLRLVF